MPFGEQGGPRGNPGGGNGPGFRHSPETRKAYFDLLEMGYTRKAASDKIGVSTKTTQNWDKGEPGPDEAIRQNHLERMIPRPKPNSRIGRKAYESINDFGLFRRRYLGRTAPPWQQEAAHLFVEWLLSDDTEFVIVNCPPGCGKTTLFTMDIPLWLICRDRTFRGFLGHRIAPTAAKYAARIRRVLERTQPLKANPGVGRYHDAEACLARDFGRFRPLTPGLPWRNDEFTVEQLYLGGIEDKEPTIASYGMETEFLGNRAPYVVWDDLVTGRILRNAERIEEQQHWYETEAETRVEPGGLLALVGQRMGPNDLYAFTREMELIADDETDQESHKYRRIIYPAHFEDKCENHHHRKDAKAFPDGCLLDPDRIPWYGRGGLATVRTNREEKYRVQYQQEDVDPAGVLVPMIYLSGGRDPETHEEYPGCWDWDRHLAEIPQGLVPPVISVATADPSPTKFWAIQWWLYHPASNQRFLLDQLRQSMDAPDFLDWNANQQCFFGVVEEWQQRSRQLGAPIRTWVIESNAAQRFLLQYDHVHRWVRRNGVNIIAHTTHIHNKSSEEFGIQMLRNVYRFGQVRLPGHNTAKGNVMPLVREATTYPDGHISDDCLMAQWFFEFNLVGIRNEYETANTPEVELWRPSFMKRGAA